VTAYYNENDGYAASWLENLIAAGHIAPGVVDRRPIQDVEAFELMEFTQCHFFAGIGVWSHALRRADWSDDRPIWTGSCPCQPFSAAGKQKGFEDERHLWPIWNKLIEQRKPPVVVGEQVDKALDWIDLVSSDLEAQNYAFGASIISAAGFEGAHIRHRNYFVGLGNSGDFGRQQQSDGFRSDGEGVEQGKRFQVKPSKAVSDADGVAYNNNSGLEGRTGMSECTNQLPARKAGLVDGLADTTRQQQQHRSGNGRQTGRIEYPVSSGINEFEPANAPMLGRQAVDWLYGREGKWRPVESGTFPLAHAAPARVGRLRAYGNALDAETATQFCEVVREIIDGI
jgi:DNA (cytosine-5)-methyltransferase 1